MRQAVMVLVFTVLIGVGRAEGRPYPWPVEKAAPALTSTFGEYRWGRFHAGLDLKTWGHTGYPVQAVADGYVWRIRTSPWGYGKAVYLKLRDGRTAVYGHLSRFIPVIAKLVEAEQDRRGTYSVNLFLPKNQIPVRRGETVGYSGRTGTEFPHLHFELRDAEQRPINALIHGIEVRDTTPPTILSLALVPLDGEALADGGHNPDVLSVRWRARAGRYRARGPVAVQGRIGVCVETYDRADASKLTNHLAPYRLRLLVDGKEAFRSTYTVFGYDQVHQVDLDRNFGLRQRGFGQFYNLFRKKGNTLPLYGKYHVGDGVLLAGLQPGKRGMALSPGLHTVAVIVGDVAGNRTEATVKVVVDVHPRVLEARATPVAGKGVRVSARVVHDGPLQVFYEGSLDGGRTWRHLRSGGSPGEVSARVPSTARMLYRVWVRDALGQTAFQTCAPAPTSRGSESEAAPVLRCTPVYFPEFAVIRIDSDRLLCGPPVVHIRWPDGKEGALAVEQRTLNSYEAVLPFDPDENGEVRLTASAVGLDGKVGEQALRVVQERVRPSGGTVRSADGMAEARFEAGGAYRTFFARVSAESAPDTLPAAGLAYRFSPESVPFDRGAELTLHYPAGFGRPDRLGLYERQPDSTWKFVDNRLDLRAGTVSGRVTHFSTYVLLLDEVPPTVADLRPASGATVEDRTPLLSATIRDTESGIGREEDITMLLDGKRMIARYDPQEERVTARPRQPLQAGLHRLEVMVRDMCGNEGRAESQFRVEYR